MIDRMTTVIFDLDGVIYRGEEPLPGSADTVRMLKEAGVKIGFLTNNSGRNTRSYIEKLAGLGIKADATQIMNSGEATAQYMITRGWSGSRIYVIGRDDLAITLRDAGFDVDLELEGEPCDFVVVGWDRSFGFYHVVRAQHEIMVNGAKLIATNADAVFPADEGRVLPGAGTMVAAVEVASGTKALVIGKPKTIGLELLLDKLDVAKKDGEDVWMVGDRLDTDIACGKSYGTKTILVTTGISTREMAENAPKEMRPDYVIDSLVELPEILVG